MLADVPMVIILVGLAAYTVLAGADFGAGFWTLVPGGPRTDTEAIRAHARHAIGPVWEANHVWLIFVLVITWTAYPTAFGSIFSTLAIPLSIAAVGIILRGTAYALRSQADGTRVEPVIDRVFALSSILTPFALGTVVGAIASGRVPVGNAAGHLFTSWLSPVPIVIGALTVATSAYLAAVYLCADARRLGEPELESDFRLRALGMGSVAGVLAAVGLVFVHADARYLWHGFTHGGGLAFVIISGVAGVATLLLVWRRSFAPARVSAALAVTAVIAGWALAQEPRFLPGLTIRQAAAGHSTLVSVVIVAVIAAVVLIPSLVLLFGLFLRGRFDPGAELPSSPALPLRPLRYLPIRGLLTAAALVAGVGLMVFADPGWTHALGIACLIAFALSTFGLVTALPDE